MVTQVKKAPFQHHTYTRSITEGERIHSDTKEVPTRSKRGHKYAVCFVDDATRRGKCYPLKRKTDVLDAWRTFLEEEILARGLTVRYFRSDNGTEFTGELAAFNRVRGIKAERSPPKCQSMNGVAEVFWRETFKAVRAILWDQQRGDEWWAAALHFASHIRNHLLTSAVAEVPPEVAWTGKAVDTSRFRVPLCRCWSYIEKEDRTDSLDRRGLEGVFVGYSSHSPCYLIYHPENDTVYARRYDDVTFDERSAVDPEKDGEQPTSALVDAVLLELDRQTEESTNADQTDQEQQNEAQNDSGFMRTTQSYTVARLAEIFRLSGEDYLAVLREYDGWYQDLTSTKDLIRKGSDVPVPEGVGSGAAGCGPLPQGKERTKRSQSKESKQTKSAATPRVEVAHSKNAQRRSARIRGAEEEPRVARAMQALERMLDDHQLLWEEERNNWSNEHALRAHDQHNNAVVNTQIHPDPRHWKAARTDPRSAQWRKAEEKEWNGLWNKDCFEEADITGDKKLHHMIWTYKTKSDSTFKARLCLDGRRQDPSTYSNISSPTMQMASMRILLALAAHKGWSVYADDAAQAFLNAPRPADQPLYVSYPEGYKNNKKGKCMLLRKMLYGLHDAPMGWFQEVRKHLVNEQGMTQGKVDQCYFYKKGVHLVVHVDDFLLTGDETEVAKVRKALWSKFEMSGGPVDEYYGLRIKVKKADGEITIDCEKYIEKTMDKLRIPRKKRNTPMQYDQDLPKREGDVDKKLQQQYRRLVGSAMHPAVTCRPDVAAAVRELSSHLQNPGLIHLQAAIRVMQYLWTTKHFALTFSRGSDDCAATTFYGTCDAAHNVTHDAKGITGWAYLLCGAAISWKCRAQPITALSSTEAELIAIDDAVRELRYLHKLLEEFGQQVRTPTWIGQDNMSTIAIIRNGRFSARTKHVALRYHHVGDLVKAGQVKVSYLPTGQMTADLLTKGMTAEAHELHRAVIMGHRPLQPGPDGGPATENE